MISSTRHIEGRMDDSQDIPYDLAYDDMDTFVRSCGVVLPDTDIEPRLRSLSFI